MSFAFHTNCRRARIPYNKYPHADLLTPAVADELNSHYHVTLTWLSNVTSQYGENGCTKWQWTSFTPSTDTSLGVETLPFTSSGTFVRRVSLYDTISFSFFMESHVHHVQSLALPQKHRRMCWNRTGSCYVNNTAMSYMWGPEDAWRVNGSWWKVPQMHRELTEDPADIRKLTEVDGGPTDAQKVDWSWQKIQQPYGTFSNVLQTHKKLTEFDGSFADARKVDGRFCGCTESRWKVPRMHRKLTEVRKEDGRSGRCMKNFR